MTRAGSTTATRPRDRRAQILSGAADLFADRGFAAVSVQEIGERTGVTGAAIYKHFPSKDAVLQELLVENIDTWVAVSRTARDEARSAGLPAVDAMVAGVVQLVVDRAGRLATYMRERHRIDAASRDHLARGETELGRCWGEAIREVHPDLTPGEVAARQHAINGVLTALARRPALLEVPRSRALVTAGLVAVARAPHLAEGAGPPAVARGGWAPPVTRRQQIIAAAMALFAERGFHGVGLNEVGESLGMAGPSIYEHFPTKSEILLDAYDHVGGLVAAGADEALRRADGVDEALDGIVSSFIAVAFDNVELITVTSREGGSLPAEERPRLVRRRHDLHDVWAAVLRELRPELSTADARLLVRATFPLVQQVARQARNRPSVAATAALAGAFLRGADPTHRSIQEEQ